MAKPLVSIIIAHFETPELIKLCLRSIRLHTSDVPFEVVVLDNASRDEESLAYLRQVEWIRLIERREGVTPEAEGHKEAVDLGISMSDAPFVLTMHTDLIPVRSDWLSWQLARMESGERIGAVGTYKLELKSRFELLLHRIERFSRRHGRERVAGGDDQPYIRSHCALYKRELLERFNLRYCAPGTAGRNIHFGLIERGYEARLLDVAEALKRFVHLNHATKVLRPELGTRPRTARRGLRRISQFLNKPGVRAILDDESLDRGRIKTIAGGP